MLWTIPVLNNSIHTMLLQTEFILDVYVYYVEIFYMLEFTNYAIAINVPQKHHASHVHICYST